MQAGGGLRKVEANMDGRSPPKEERGRCTCLSSAVNIYVYMYIYMYRSVYSLL